MNNAFEGTKETWRDVYSKKLEGSKKSKTIIKDNKN